MLRILGCGNPLVGDDGVGVHIINKLMKEIPNLPINVELIDAGVCGLEMLNLIENADKVIIVDAVKGAGKVGTIHRFNIEELKNSTSSCTKMSIHDTGIMDVLCIAEHVQQLPQEIIIYAVEIEEPEEISIGLSDKVENAANKIISLLVDEINQISY